MTEQFRNGQIVLTSRGQEEITEVISEDNVRIKYQVGQDCLFFYEEDIIASKVWLYDNDKLHDFIKTLGVLEFSFASDGTLYYNTVIDIMSQDGRLIKHEIAFFFEDLSEFKRLDSVNLFLKVENIFEVVEFCEEDDTRQTIFHRKYEQTNIENPDNSELFIENTRYTTKLNPSDDLNSVDTYESNTPMLY